MLHIHNGDVSANTAKQSSLPGEHFAFREALMEGPAPPDLTPTEWRDMRARHLSEAYGLEGARCVRELSEQAEKLESFKDHEEVVLWFEHDLFCQANLIYLLNWFGQQQLRKTKLSLICIDNFPGRERFRGLGELNSSELASLFPKRKELNTEHFDLASAAWIAYTSSDPTNIQNLLQFDTTALPFLGQALKAHLERFPSTKNGLGRIENRALQLTESGRTRFTDLFARFGDAEPVYGLGDSQFWLALRCITNTGQPLVRVTDEGNNKQSLMRDLVQTAEFEITNLGKAVLNGEADFVVLNGIDVWLGGVHLSGDRKLWRWDETKHEIRHD